MKFTLQSYSQMPSRAGAQHLRLPRVTIHTTDHFNDSVSRFQRQQPTSGGTVSLSRMQIVVNTSLQTVFSTVFWIRKLIKAATTLGLLAIMATHPALMRCTPEHRPYYKVSMSGVCSQCHRSWGELFMKSLFWMGTFEVFWSSKRSRVQTN